MPDSESIKKMLRSVLQSSKEGVPLSRVQSEYWSLCGERIPLSELGHAKLEDYVRSIPSVVRLECRMGQLICFAAVCKETAHIAELVAKQKSSKKSGYSQVINCSLRFKRSDPYMLNVRPKSSLRQPSATGASNWIANRSLPHGGPRVFSASGDYRQLDQRLSSMTPVEHRTPSPQPAVKQVVLPERKETLANGMKPRERENPPEQITRTNKAESCPYNVRLVQSRVTQLLEKYCSGLWMSKLPTVYSLAFNQTLHPQVLVDLEKWTHICLVEKPSNNLRPDRLIYPPLPASTILRSPASNGGIPNLLPPSINLAVNASGSKASHTLLPTASLNHKQNSKPPASPRTCPPPTNAPSPPSPCLRGPGIFPLLKVTLSTSSDAAPCPPSISSAAVVSAEVHQRIKELLVKYSHGLWVSALPKLFVDTYKTPFPEHILDNLSLLLDICTVESVTSRDEKKAILYYISGDGMEATDDQDDKQCRPIFPPSGLEVVSPVMPPCLVFPIEQHPSVLVTDAKSANAVTVRYVGQDYSDAQEAMEDSMLSFYNKSPTVRHVSNPVVGELVAVRGPDGDELSRAQVMEVMAPDKFKVYYVDYGLPLDTPVSELLELHQDFLSLPFQATNVQLAGLEAFSSHPLLLSFLATSAIGKILLMEKLEPGQHNETPVVLLYDTSQDDEVIINSTFLKSLQDQTMNNSLTVDAIYTNVHVTNVCAGGIIFCQLPSKGTERLHKLLEEVDAIFTSQVTSESLVSRPFTAKSCLARYKEKWSRVEIIKMYGIQVMDILFIDLGITVSVAVTELREVPPLLLKEFTAIPPQATKCHLVDPTDSEGDWSLGDDLWLKETVLESDGCKIKVVKLDKSEGEQLVHVYLYKGADCLEQDKSINHQLAKFKLWNEHPTLNGNASSSRSSSSSGCSSCSSSSMDTGQSALMENLTPGSLLPQPNIRTSTRPLPAVTSNTGTQPLLRPPTLELPQPGQNMDVFVSLVHHPGNFVLQQWQEMHKLVVLMGEMILYYNRMWGTNKSPRIRKGALYAAKIDKNWHRVQVRGILANGLVSVYELDYGKPELVHSNMFQPLIEEFRHLPFQAITAQLAGVTQREWSDEASVLFRKHVEDRALVAEVVSVQEASEVEGELQQPKLTVYLVDTKMKDQDLWIHNIMGDA